jgi:hypothetical protein
MDARAGQRRGVVEGALEPVAELGLATRERRLAALVAPETRNGTQA